MVSKKVMQCVKQLRKASTSEECMTILQTFDVNEIIEVRRVLRELHMTRKVKSELASKIKKWKKVSKGNSKSHTGQKLPGDSTEVRRELYAKLIYDGITCRSDIIIASESVPELACRIENIVFLHFGGTTTEYEHKIYSLLRDLTNKANAGLRESLINGELSPESFTKTICTGPIEASKLAILNAFRADVWGNDTILRKHATRHSELNARTVEYLDLGEHLDAVRCFCRGIKARDQFLLVTQQYRDAMAAFRSENRKYAPGACVLGKSGIGKTCFIAYAVIEQLRQRRPVAVQVDWPEPNAYILFSEDAVTLHSSMDMSPFLHERSQRIWCFSDSNDETEIPTKAFRFSWDHVRIFQMANRWMYWAMSYHVQRYRMCSWPLAEMEDLVFIQSTNMLPYGSDIVNLEVRLSDE